MGPRLQDEQRRIVHWLAANCHRTWTRREVATALGMETSSVAGRVNGLLKLGAVVEIGTKLDPLTGREVGAITLPPFQADMFGEAA
jgi:DNA-binding Lrp family transcriptional regulator